MSIQRKSTNNKEIGARTTSGQHRPPLGTARNSMCRSPFSPTRANQRSRTVFAHHRW
jgi:hypothetical protein